MDYSNESADKIATSNIPLGLLSPEEPSGKEAARGIDGPLGRLHLPARNRFPMILSRFYNCIFRVGRDNVDWGSGSLVVQGPLPRPDARN